MGPPFDKLRDCTLNPTTQQPNLTPKCLANSVISDGEILADRRLVRKNFNNVSMRLIINALASILFTLASFGQEPFYKQMMYDDSYNFYDVVDSANAWFEKHGTRKGSGFKPFQRWANENESKFYPTGDRSNAYFEGATTAYQVLKSDHRRTHHKAELSSWEELGPWDANNITSHYSPGIGRVETFWVNPSNTDEIMLGSRSGGFWKTTDGGVNWVCTTDTLIVTGVQSIAVNPFDKNDVIIAIRQGGNSNTHGIYRSSDGGITWSETRFNPSITNLGGLGRNGRIYKLAFHPTRRNMIFIGTNNGLYVSKNDLVTWMSSTGGNITDIEFHPSRADIVYAYNNSGSDRNSLKVSRDTGSNFSTSTELTGNNNARCFIAVTPQQPKFVYLASKNGVWQSRNEGLFFSMLSNPDEDCQGFAISDTDADNMIYGYVDTEASTDGGQTFTQVTWWSDRSKDASYVHADIRALECLDGVFYVGTDGYLAKSSDKGQSWTRLNDGTAIRENYAVGLGQSNINQQMAGSQDNGTSILNDEGWLEWNGGDGMEALVHPLNNDVMLGSWQFGSRNYTYDGGQTRYAISNPERGSGNADWEAPLLMDPENHLVVYHFANKIYRSEQFGVTWAQYSAPEIGIIREAAMSETSSNVMAIARNSTLRITEDAGKSWDNIEAGLPGYSITDIAFDPRNDSTIVVTYNRYQNDSRKIYISHDRGRSWSNITNNLNDMPLRTVVIDHTENRNIYVGGEIGVYYMEMGGDTWKLLGEELPNVTVKDLEINYGANTIKAATWGRGLWQHRLANMENAPRILTTRTSQTPSNLEPKVSNPQVITCEIESTSDITDATVYYSINGTELDKTISMSNTSGNFWVSSEGIPSPELGDEIYFKVIATAANGKTAETFRFYYILTKFEFCDAFGTANTTTNWIKNLKLADFENESTKTEYSDFLHSNIILTEGETYTLTIQLDRSYAPDSAGAWIDFNNNTSFEPSEAVNMSSYDGSFTSTGTFTVPSDAVFYEKVRMRVRNSFGENPDPCGEVVGEVEDYGIILHHSKTSDVPEVGLSSFSLCPNPTYSTFTVKFDKPCTSGAIVIYSVDGKLMLSRFVSNSTEVSVDHNLVPGSYVVEVIADGVKGSRKLIVQG